MFSSLIHSPTRPVHAGVRRTAVAYVSAAVAALSLATQVAAAQWTVVASGLNNPRGLDFAPNGALFIAEAGVGGDGPKIPGAEGEMQFGLSGSVTKLFKGEQTRVITGLPSLGGEGGFGAVGPAAISFGQQGHAFLAIGLGQPPAVRSSLLPPAAASMAVLFQMNQNGKVKAVADLGAFEAANDPDGHGPDTNPNGVLSDTAGGVYVTDAGANALLHIDARGRVTVAAVFPDRLIPTPPFLPQPPFGPQFPMQAVPTNVVRGPDGALYVSQLTGFPFPVGGANIYRVVPGSTPTVFASGFTNVIDLAFDDAGNLYVLEIDQNGLAADGATGRLVRVPAGGGDHVTIASDGLVMPGGLAIGPDGALYVSNFSVMPGMGQVVRIVP
jgi:sugar lactone lactonase YvrE